MSRSLRGPGLHRASSTRCPQKTPKAAPASAGLSQLWGVARRIARGRRDGREELRLVLGVALDPEDLGRVFRRLRQHQLAGVPPRIGRRVDECDSGPDVDGTDDPQRQHPAGALLLTTTACGAWVTGNWMSQYGSRDQARAGKGYATILKSYYSGIVITG